MKFVKINKVGSLRKKNKEYDRPTQGSIGTPATIGQQNLIFSKVYFVCLPPNFLAKWKELIKNEQKLTLVTMGNQVLDIINFENFFSQD